MSPKRLDTHRAPSKSTSAVGSVVHFALAFSMTTHYGAGEALKVCVVEAVSTGLVAHPLQGGQSRGPWGRPSGAVEGDSLGAARLDRLR